MRQHMRMGQEFVSLRPMMTHLGDMEMKPIDTRSVQPDCPK